jgi:hypothetical protein
MYDEFKGCKVNLSDKKLETMGIMPNEKGLNVKGDMKVKKLE